MGKDVENERAKRKAFGIFGSSEKQVGQEKKTVVDRLVVVFSGQTSDGRARIPGSEIYRRTAEGLGEV